MHTLVERMLNRFGVLNIKGVPIERCSWHVLDSTYRSLANKRYTFSATGIPIKPTNEFTPEEQAVYDAIGEELQERANGARERRGYIDVL